MVLKYITFTLQITLERGIVSFNTEMSSTMNRLTNMKHKITQDYAVNFGTVFTIVIEDCDLKDSRVFSFTFLKCQCRLVLSRVDGNLVGFYKFLQQRKMSINMITEPRSRDRTFYYTLLFSLSRK